MPWGRFFASWFASFLRETFTMPQFQMSQFQIPASRFHGPAASVPEVR
jgi:hypothetical protein